MFWILAAIFLILALAVPRFRVVGIVGVVVLALLLTWAMVQRGSDEERAELPSEPQRGSPASPAPTRVTVAPKHIGLRDLQLTGSGAPFEFSGRVINRAEGVEVKSVTVQVTRRDCYEGALDPSGCAVLWRGQQWISIEVPPQQERSFQQAVWAPPMPRVRGTIRDDFQLLSASGEPAEFQEGRETTENTENTESGE